MALYKNAVREFWVVFSAQVGVVELDTGKPTVLKLCVQRLDIIETRVCKVAILEDDMTLASSSKVYQVFDKMVNERSLVEVTFHYWVQKAN